MKLNLTEPYVTKNQLKVLSNKGIIYYNIFCPTCSSYFFVQLYHGQVYKCKNCGSMAPKDKWFY